MPKECQHSGRSSRQTRFQSTAVAWSPPYRRASTKFAQILGWRSR